ncbi:MAG: carboxylesterase/lipase family protein [Clostridia bacterium]|nr:carboxylesterase/lipase family protein [Clostridia bacterium]
MKKLFSLEDILSAVVTAFGYGMGAIISRVMQLPDLICFGLDLLVGFAIGEVTNRIRFSKAFRGSTRNRVVLYASLFFCFILAHTLSVTLTGISLMDYLHEEFVNVFVFPFLGLVLNLILRAYRIRKIRRRYADGEQGYVFDLSEKEIEKTNKQNQKIQGEYNKNHAVKTRTGIYVGGKKLGTRSYLGIPYAKPPVGERRWKAPEPLPDSDEVFEAKYYGASAIQVDHGGSILKNHRQSEDCLTLNIYAGAFSENKKRPVMVFFHHGDFASGGSADPILDAEGYVMKNQDTLFVSFNSRLGIFGYIDFSEVPGGEAYPDTLNLGLLDQVAALKWIKENIAAFGGDPDRITVFGFDSGATCILMLAASGQAKGLFNRAFVFNGSTALAYNTPDASRALAKDLLEATKTTTMDELMRLDTDTLKEAAQKLWENACAPTCDGKWIPVDTYKAFREGSAAGIDFIFGISRNTRQMYHATFGSENYGKMVDAGLADLLSIVDEETKEHVQAYIEAQSAASGETEAKAKVVEQWLALWIYRGAVSLAACGNHVHLLYWAKKALIEKLGSSTMDVIATLLGNKDALEMYGSVVDDDLAEVLQNLMTKYINMNPMLLREGEIKGIDPIDWQDIPKALIVLDEEVRMEPVEDRLTEVEGLLDFVVSRDGGQE